MNEECMTNLNLEGINIEFSNITFKVKDKISALTHFIAFILSILGLPLLLIYISTKGLNTFEMLSYAIFGLSMIGLYGASTAYHTFNLKSDKGNMLLKKIDHLMIFILIAGTYTPLCINILPEEYGLPLLIAIWAFALLGIIFKLFFIACPKWVSSTIYISMGWLCIFVFKVVYENLSKVGFILLLLGGISYTIGGIIYSLKLDFLKNVNPEFGAHEVFHIFVMIGSFFHFLTMLT